MRSRLAMPCALLLVGALAGCLPMRGVPSGARFSLGPVRVSRAPGSVPTSSDFPSLEAADLTASQGDVSGPAVRGQVLALDAEPPRPLAGAIVSTSDGRAARSDADGRYAIPGAWPKDGGFVVAHPAFVASALAGVAEGPSLDLHLRARVTQSEAATASAEAPFAARGRVVDEAGVGIADALVVLEDARGAFSAPVSTGPDGGFTLTVFAPGRRVEAGTLLAVRTDDAGAWVGLRQGVAVGADDGGAGEVTAVAATREVTPVIDATAAVGLPLRSALWLVAADGTSLAVPSMAGRVRVAPLAGAHYELRALAADASLGVSSELRQEVALAGEGPLQARAALLAPPGQELDPALVLNEALRWSAVPGAAGYHLSLAGVAGEGFLWEGYVTEPTMPLSFQGTLPGGLYGLTLTAWDAPGLGARAVAALGPRRLRLPEQGASWRRASRQFRVEL